MNPSESIRAALNHDEGPLAWIELLFHWRVAAEILGKQVGEISGENPDFLSQVELCRELGLGAVGFPVYDRFGSHKETAGDSYRWVPHLLERSDLPKLKIPALDREGLRRQVQMARASIGDSGLSFFVAGMFCVASSMNDMGTENFCIKIYEDPGFVRKVMERYAEYNGQLFDFFSDLPEVDFLWIADDIAHKTSTFFSPRLFREQILPVWRQIVTHIRKPWIFHSDGNLMPILDDLLELGMSGLHPVEEGAMDIFQLKEEIGERVALVGNVNMDLLMSNQPQKVEAIVTGLADRLTPGGGYLLSSGNSISSGVKTANVRAMSVALQHWNSSRFEV